MTRYIMISDMRSTTGAVRAYAVLLYVFGVYTARLARTEVYLF